MVSGSILANYFSPEYLPGGNGGGSLDFLTRVSFGGGTGKFSHQSIFLGEKGGIIYFFIFSFSRDQDEDWRSFTIAWPLIVYILSMEDGLVSL